MGRGGGRCRILMRPPLGRVVGAVVRIVLDYQTAAGPVALSLLLVQIDFDASCCLAAVGKAGE